MQAPSRLVGSRGFAARYGSAWPVNASSLTRTLVSPSAAVAGAGPQNGCPVTASAAPLTATRPSKNRREITSPDWLSIGDKERDTRVADSLLLTPFACQVDCLVFRSLARPSERSLKRT